MSHTRDSSPVYYREIQKNAFLKRIPDEVGGSKLRPLGLKKPILKPLWTQLCVHNGRTPYLEQYRDPTSARAHRPVWRASLQTARHVTASVTPRDNEYDFLVDTHHGPVRMLAPDWEAMQDWVNTLRNKLHELKILPLCENVYCAPPAAPPARAPARDPMSPLPPTPPVPPDRVPGIDLTPIIRSAATVTQPPEPPDPEPQNEPPPPPPSTNTITAIPASENIDISSWESTEMAFTSLPSTSQAQAPTSVAKICGQNICLDDSIFKRTIDSDDDDFLSERSSVSSKTSKDTNEKDTYGVSKDAYSSSKDAYGSSKDAYSSSNDAHSSSKDAYVSRNDYSVVNKDKSDVSSFRQTVVVSDGKQCDSVENGTGDRPTNITVIQVSNKEPPHTAIPVIGSETDVFDFEFKSAPNTRNPNFINIVNTEVNVQNSNDYGTVFEKNESEYGHLSLTTTVSLTGDVKSVNVKGDKEGLYERLCLASTSNDSRASPLSIRRLKSQDKVRKSSLPNLDTVSSDSTYEYLFLSQNNNSTDNVASNTTIITPLSTNVTPVSTNVTPISTNITTTAANVTTISTTSLTNTSNVTLNSEMNSNSRVHVNSVAVVNPNSRVIRSNVERSNSQNTCDTSPRRERRMEQNGPKRNAKVEKTEPNQPKPIWRRGLTELSLLSRLRGIGQGKRHESPNRNGSDDRNAVTSPVKVVNRSRPEARVDRSRRRSSSLSNGQSPPSASTVSLQTLRARQAAALRSEQRRGAALVAPVRSSDPVFADYNNQVWVAWWGAGGSRFAGRAGDRACGVRGAQPRDAAHARHLAHAHAYTVDILFHRVPLGKIYVVNKRDQENLGIKLDGECNITSVAAESPAAAAGIPPPGKWAVTEVNNRPLNLLKGGEEEMNRLSLNGTEASVLIQPSALVKKLRAAIKGNKTILGLR